ncbi:hypothetical protein [Pseudomonas sp. DC1.2]|uniref:hypothetical protein n=1 Tax=Pseudomonas sp. DC1.2 TaxID=3048622 RepID=UPI002AC90F49|nr:hypothetical protein [Pseudomonas sp. DC1.2]WPX60989.1 hypothetical protein RHM68_10270 [Pseudomonas sp. DC1.2]
MASTHLCVRTISLWDLPAMRAFWPLPVFLETRPTIRTICAPKLTSIRAAGIFYGPSIEPAEQHLQT